MKYIPTTEKVPFVPLYAVTDPKNDAVEFMGTGTLIRFSGIPLLATAAHVIDNGRQFVLLIAGADAPVQLNRSSLCTPVRYGMTRQTDPLDFCITKLTDEEAATLCGRCRFIDWEKEALLDVPALPQPHKIIGYPDLNNDPDDVKKTLAANALRIDVFEDRDLITHSPSADHKKHPRWYLGLRYVPSLVDKQDIRPKVVTLHGFSGGPIWRTDGTHLCGFAGIVTESPPPTCTGQRMIYGFRATAIDDLLKKWREDGHI